MWGLYGMRCPPSPTLQRNYRVSFGCSPDRAEVLPRIPFVLLRVKQSSARAKKKQIQGLTFALLQAGCPNPFAFAFRKGGHSAFRFSVPDLTNGLWTSGLAL